MATTCGCGCSVWAVMLQAGLFHVIGAAAEAAFNEARRHLYWNEISLDILLLATFVNRIYWTCFPPPPLLRVEDNFIVIVVEVQRLEMGGKGKMTSSEMPLDMEDPSFRDRWNQESPFSDCGWFLWLSRCSLSYPRCSSCEDLFCYANGGDYDLGNSQFPGRGWEGGGWNFKAYVMRFLIGGVLHLPRPLAKKIMQLVQSGI